MDIGYNTDNIKNYCHFYDSQKYTNAHNRILFNPKDRINGNVIVSTYFPLRYVEDDVGVHVQKDKFSIFMNRKIIACEFYTF